MKGDQVGKLRADAETVADVQARLGGGGDGHYPEIKLQLPRAGDNVREGCYIFSY